ncbi:hypothetical protein AVEN_20770-1 [Araneus ventricosus]|uniref:Uncharacterized protein n=1 Tax=Araneus ventricosus TaxID=182803 RepID=A0A4Y2NBJ3_ARAVE|nr:hypothetical protein AVEN_20770-1 [Araneus ventricosus]
MKRHRTPDRQGGEEAGAVTTYFYYPENELGTHILSGTQNSPYPFFPDLTSCDFFVELFEVHGLSWWGLNLEDLNNHISRALLSIPGEILLSVVENVANKMQCVIHKKVGHIERGLYPGRGSALIE